MDLNALGIETNFGVLDWCIVVGYLLAVVAVGVYVKRYVSNVTDFIVAGRGLKTFLAVATMIGTELGLVTVMYSAQIGFSGGFAAFHIALAATIVTLVVGLTGFIVVPLRRLNIMTIPEFYEKRFGRGVRILGGIMLAFSGILNMGMFLKAGSLFVMGITGMTQVVHLKVIMTVLLGMVLLYTTLGGMVSIVVLDYIQFVILSFGLLSASLLSIRYFGWDNIIETVTQVKGQAAGFDPFSSEGFGVPYVVWMFFLGLVSCAVWQTAVIRACSAENTRTVKRLYVVSSIGFLMRFLLPCFLGICALVFAARHTALKEILLPDSGDVDPQTTLLAMPVFLSQILPAGLIGIISAGMLAAFMSTHDSYLLCWSSVLTQDVVAPWFKRGLSSKKRLLLTRVFILAIGIFILIWGLWYPLGQDLWNYMAISGAIYFAGAIALLVFGLYWKRASKVGAYSALLCGFFAALGLTPVQNLFNPIKLRFGFTEHIPIKDVTEKTILVVKDIPIEEITAKTVEVYKTVGSEIVGLVVIALAVLAMIVGSVLFPQSRTSSEPKE